MGNSTKLLIQAWALEKVADVYHISATHYIYLTEIVKYYPEVCLLSPVLQLTSGESNLTPIRLPGIKIYELPYSATYLSAIKNLGAYIAAYAKLSKQYDKVYVRYPSPFGWLSQYYFKDIIVHFVGDPIDATLGNPNFSRFKKQVLINLFRPEHYMYLTACKRAKVFTNGHHIQQKLQKQGIRATAVISSTLNDTDFLFCEHAVIDAGNLKLLYAGYLRRAKGVETLIRSFAIILKKHPHAVFTIVGSGEFEQELKALANELGLKNNVNFKGHINDRDQLNHFYRTHDVFCFASLSEGSPRVVLEAMANGINVLSTPVGSLPAVFKDGQDIIFAEAGNPQDFADKILAITSDNKRTMAIRLAAFNKAKKYTTANFIKTIFQ